MKPALFSSFKNYNSKTLISDIIAGVIVGIIAIPLSIALSIASGASPEAGLFTAVIAGLVVALFGGSRVQISGPTGAFVVIVYNIIAKFGLQ
jgi:SulP family sulfate permease